MKHEVAYQATCVACLLEVDEEGHFEFPVGMIVNFVGFQNLVETLI